MKVSSVCGDIMGNIETAVIRVVIVLHLLGHNILTIALCIINWHWFAALYELSPLTFTLLGLQYFYISTYIYAWLWLVGSTGFKLRILLYCRSALVVQNANVKARDVKQVAKIGE